MDIPKEVCVRAKVNPRKTKRPIIKKWCYSPERSDSDTSDTTTDTDTESEDTTLDPLVESDIETENPPPRRG